MPDEIAGPTVAFGDKATVHSERIVFDDFSITKAIRLHGSLKTIERVYQFDFVSAFRCETPNAAGYTGCWRLARHALYSRYGDPPLPHRAINVHGLF